MVTDEMVEAAMDAYDASPADNVADAMRAALKAAERAAPPNGKPANASRSIMLKSLRQWMKEMRGAVE